jgi:succinyl-diaminopimelate desuccinylase
MSEYERIDKKIEEYREAMVEMQKELCKRPAISPVSGGKGEIEKAQYIKRKLEEVGFDSIDEYDAKDPKAKKGIRPNLVAKLHGKSSEKTIWFMTHMDVVPPGDLKLWHTDPWKATVKEGKIYGRGTTDNQQDLVASLYVVKAIKDLGITPPYDVGLVIVSDEETGSKYGLSYLLKVYPGFKKEDLILVPDFPSPDGSLIEVAEKSIMWLKFVAKGKQTHGSTPEKGINANRVASELICRLDKMLHESYPKRNELFDPPNSTFEPTKREGNVPNVNTIPGEDVFYWDCRVLPAYNLKEIFSKVEAEVKQIEKKFKVSVSIEKVMFDQAAPPTPKDALVVESLRKAVKRVYGVDTKTIGIGGGTVAAYFRRAGFDAAVWGKSDETEHQPNEYCIIDNMVNDAKAFATLCLE